MNALFELPALLIHLVLVAALAALLPVARNARLARLKPWPGVRRAAANRTSGPYAAIGVLGLAFLVVALAGPRGSSNEASANVGGRDVVIVLDVSRSMQAEQPSRLERAVRALRPLTEAKRLPAGTRLGMVVFAAEPVRLFPLTPDRDHLTFSLDRIAAGDVPTAVRGDTDAFVSGTRLGAALRLAAETFPNSSGGDVVLLTDGDDPANDDEWRDGLSAVRARGSSLHVVAVGEPGVAATIPFGDGVLAYDTQPVKTRVRSELLTALAKEAGGELLICDRGDVPLFRSLQSAKSSETPAASRPLPGRSSDRTPWLAAALICGVIAALRLTMRRSFAAASLALVAAMPSDDLLRRGQAAFARGDFVQALELFDRAQPRADDPGLVAFNRAATCYRLGRFDDAADAYRQALDDAEIPDYRRRRALYDLGNALLAQSKNADRRLLEAAIEAYRRGLAADPPNSLKSDIDHNLALAVAFWNKTQPPERPSGSDTNPDAKPGDPKTGDGGNGKKTDVPSKRPDNSNAADTTGGSPGEKSKNAAIGRITVLPDDAAPIRLTPEQISATLSGNIDRIARDRLRDRTERSNTLPPRGKDW